MLNVVERRYFLIGEGGIDPSVRVASGEVSEALIDDLCERLQTDEFYDDVDPEMIANDCVDGRGNELVGPNAAGGTFTYVMGDALGPQSMREPGEKAPAHARRVFGAFGKLNKKIGGHDGEHMHGASCDCGAEDRLDPKEGPSILNYTVRRSDDIREFLDSLGVSVDDETHDAVALKAQQLHDEEYATNGADLRNVTIEVGGVEAVKTKPGKHVEAVLAVNVKSGKTLNRARIHAAYDGLIDAFGLDVPAVVYGSNLLAADEEEADARLYGSLCYNVAVAGVLAKNLRIVVHQ